MPTELMKHYYRNTSAHAYVHMTMAVHCAPFLKGIKDSALLVVKPEEAKVLGKLLCRMNARCKTMVRNDKKVILLLYRQECMKKCLMRTEVQEFLKQFGYGQLETFSEQELVNQVLEHLKHRFIQAYGCRHEFPHEIGIFLDYPMEDVIGFIENSGQNYLMSGYWKVYSNQEQAQRVFQSYDEARESAIYEILEGKKFYEIAV